MALYRAGELEEALEVLEGAAEAKPSLWLDLPRAFLLAEQPDRRDEAAALARSLASRVPPGHDPLFARLVLLLLGHPKEAEAICRAYRRGEHPLPLLRREFFQALLDYCCGDLDEEALLEAAGASRCNRCEAHFFIAMTKLAAGGSRRGQGTLP